MFPIKHTPLSKQIGAIFSRAAAVSSMKRKIFAAVAVFVCVSGVWGNRFRWTNAGGDGVWTNYKNWEYYNFGSGTWKPISDSSQDYPGYNNNSNDAEVFINATEYGNPNILKVIQTHLLRLFLDLEKHWKLQEALLSEIKMETVLPL